MRPGWVLVGLGVLAYLLAKQEAERANPLTSLQTWTIDHHTTTVGLIVVLVGLGLLLVVTNRGRR